MPRQFERIVCPGCGRIIAAFVPAYGDGLALRVHRHRGVGRRAARCGFSDRLVVADGGRWRLE